MTRRFELGGGRIEAILHPDGDFTLDREEAYIALNPTEARALCAALIECGFGPEAGVCRWKEPTSTNQWSGECGGLHHYLGDGLGVKAWDFCPYCGKRIEVVR